jgi:serine phosphatase RsbU (regulator of sigma subunit)
MALRFRTRLTLTFGCMTVLTIVIMAGLLLFVAAGSITTYFFNQGRVTTLLAQQNISYGIELPGRIVQRVAEQMVVSALLAAEFVAVAEQNAGLSPEEISVRLRAVIERSRAVTGTALVDEFWITDESGRAYINTEGVPFTFDSGSGQTAAFLPLLEGQDKPILQDMQARELDDQLYLYVAVPGVDIPRIVQVGAGQPLIDDIRETFNLQRVLDQYLQQTEVDFIAVVNADGTPAALASRGAARPISAEELAFVGNFAAQGREPFALQEFPTQDGPENIGVVTRLNGSDDANPQALFMLYRTQPMLNLLRRSASYVIGIGILLTLVALALSLLLSRRLSQPVRQLVDVVNRFGRGDLQVRAEVSGYHEIRGLATNFNLMADNLQRYTIDLENETRQRERLESEMRIGAEVQEALLPATAPVVRGLDLAGWSLPARQVGGDFFEYFPRPQGRLLVAIGDATDKGLSAALLVTQCYSILHALVQNDHLSPAELLGRVNKTLTAQVGESARFVTLFLAEIDPDGGAIRFACAGHPPAILRRGPGKFEHLRCTVGMPLGLSSSQDFVDYAIPFENDEFLLAYSDGVTEAESIDGERYGMARLQQVLDGHLPGAAADSLEAIHADVLAFAKGKEQHDDMTLVAIGKRGGTTDY